MVRAAQNYDGAHAGFDSTPPVPPLYKNESTRVLGREAAIGPYSPSRANHEAPMTTFNDREKTFESKYKLDQELQFKVGARRNKLLGLWAAELMGIAGDDAAAYAREVVQADFEEPGDDDVLQKVLADLTDKSIEKSEHQLRKQMDELMETAREQIMKETMGG